MNDFAAYREPVRAEWVDYNGHMNVAYYVLVFDHATDAVLDQLGLGESYRSDTGCSVFVGEMHVTYRREVLLGDEMIVSSRVMAHDAKRVVLYHQMACPRVGDGVAGNEVLCVHVDLATRRTAPWPATHLTRLAAAVAGQAHQPRPGGGGGAINLLGRKRP
ncbi:MAG: thioesterase family protein [Rhodospirillales bacterium]|nr:thioesterase family protein [Rhodospirillales bacterium]